MNILKISLFALATIMMSSNAFAATGAGEAQVDLLTPLSVSVGSINFGEISIDTSAGPQVITMSASVLNCPTGYVCIGDHNTAAMTITGAPNATVDWSVDGETATLSNGAGDTIIFDPIFASTADSGSTTLNGSGIESNLWVDGTLSFTGEDLPAGIYNTTNDGGSPYTVTVIY